MGDQSPYRAVCFDLDGTLLGMDIDEFMGAYFKRLAAFVAARGHDPEPFMAGLKAGTAAMASNDGSLTNAEAFWGAMTGYVDPSKADWQALADEFYATDFARIGDGFVPDPTAASVVAELRRKGYPLALTTMPMFPLRAVEERLRWAGVEPTAFERITHYENSRSVKPKAAYFAENLAALGASGQDVLMVGNNTLEDMAFLELGADGYLVTDWLLDPLGNGVEGMRSGTLADFARWAAGLPECADPARGIQKGAVDAAATREVLAMAQGALSCSRPGKEG